MEDTTRVPENVSQDALLAALELLSHTEEGPAEAATSVYRLQLRHSLLSLARRNHLAVTAHEVTGLPESDLATKSTVELLLMLDKQRANMGSAQSDRLRYWS